MEHPEFGPVDWSNMNEYLIWLAQKQLKEKEEAKNASDTR